MTMRSSRGARVEVQEQKDEEERDGVTTEAAADRQQFSSWPSYQRVAVGRFTDSKQPLRSSRTADVAPATSSTRHGRACFLVAYLWA